MAVVSSKENFTFRFHEKTYSFDFPNAFLFGDSLARAGNIHAARFVFAALAKVGGRGPRAKIMLARCEANLHNYSECASIVGTAFDTTVPADDLHTALVYQSIGFRTDAIAALSKLATQLKDAPTISLLLGDEFAKCGDHANARRAWSNALHHDDAKGGVALAAAQRLKARGRVNSE